ncbi:MAG TPA: AzlD domain-containing protein [Rectinemataceae bacterium]|nr:AzlD domain-containing protein [Rectinemataceae bacterium]
MTVDIWASLASILAAGLVTLACRATPFLLFRQGKIPPLLDYLQGSLPPIVMTVLVFNSYKALIPLAPTWTFTTAPIEALALVVPGILAAVLQSWKGNALLSIAGATLLHMAMARLG